MVRRIGFLVGLALLLLGSVACSGVQEFPIAESPPQSSPQLSSTPTARATATRRPATRAILVNGLQTIALAVLPPEARETLILIEQGGPFPYRQDGQVFQNREGILPTKPRGYYHEYTVKTPGEDDRGARRIVTGEDGELYYTDDHYSSFKVILLHE
jgi:ribonuclease T1